MQVYKHILVCLDCSKVDAALVAHVAKLAEQNQAEATLLHVVHSHTLDQERELRQQATTSLGAFTRQFEAAGVVCHMKVLSGEPEEQIIAEAATGVYDLVALALHGHSGLASMVHGSVSRKVMGKIRVPILLWNPA